jgi:hypothetical protein
MLIFLGKRKGKLYKEEYFDEIIHVSIVSRNKISWLAVFVLRKRVNANMAR